MLPRNKVLKTHSTDLRNNATKQENHLWYDFLRKHSPHFYRQRIIGNYIVDFYSPKAKLVIELDGSQHGEEEAIENDAVRTEFFDSWGLSVLRFTNRDIDDNFEACCECIEGEILRQLS